MTKQQPGANDSSDRPALTEIEITPAMIEAGADALENSPHFTSQLRSVAEWCVRDVLRAALACSPAREGELCR